MKKILSTAFIIFACYSLPSIAYSDNVIYCDNCYTLVSFFNKAKTYSNSNTVVINPMTGVAKAYQVDYEPELGGYLIKSISVPTDIIRSLEVFKEFSEDIEDYVIREKYNHDVILSAKQSQKKLYDNIITESTYSPSAVNAVDPGGIHW